MSSGMLIHRAIIKLLDLIAAAFLLGLLAGCGESLISPDPAVGSDELSTFEYAACEFEVPDGHEVGCGYLVVPEDRSNPNSQLIRLHVAVFKSINPDPAPDPVIHLVGGPGGSLLDAVSRYLQVGGDRFLETRDYVMFNQRGTRYAAPALDCPGYTELMWDLAEQGLALEERQERELEFLLSCHTRLVDQGINLKAYNSAENAADVNDLRTALGYQQVNLYGISYGTRLALSMMRDQPEGIRSVILDSVYPPQVNIDEESPANAVRSFSAVFESCAADLYCNRTYPDLERTFYRVVANLNANPVPIVVMNRNVNVDGDYLMDGIYGALYHKDALPWVPAMIAGAAGGELTFMSDVFEAMFSDPVSFGMFYSMQCHEEVPFESYEDTRALAAELPAQIRDHYVSPYQFELCESWDSGTAAPIENEPIVSDTPALVLAGRFDPVTPPAWSKLAAETLNNSYFFEFPNVGHGVIRADECALGIALQFLDDPRTEPDAECMQGLPGQGLFK